jgi:uncharacterized repeat protein (TIGR04052 family)
MMQPRYVAILLATLSIAACGDPPLRVAIPFAAAFAGADVTCSGQSPVQLTDLRFYVYDLHLIDADGQPHALELIADDTWQRDGLALLDLEDGSGSCLNGTAASNAVIAGTVADGEYRGLGFTLGVPFELNHGDPLRAAAPLGDADMHWHWRGGYKFLRAGVRSADDRFWLHLGSTGCEGTIRNITGCSSPNRVSVTIADFEPGRDAVRVDLSALVAGDVLADGEGSDCSSGPAETSCVAPFRALGLDHATGGVSGPQRLFTRQTPE